MGCTQTLSWVKVGMGLSPNFTLGNNNGRGFNHNFTLGNNRKKVWPSLKLNTVGKINKRKPNKPFMVIMILQSNI